LTRASTPPHLFRRVSFRSQQQRYFSGPGFPKRPHSDPVVQSISPRGNIPKDLGRPAEKCRIPAFDRRSPTPFVPPPYSSLPRPCPFPSHQDVITRLELQGFPPLTPPPFFCRLFTRQNMHFSFFPIRMLYKPLLRREIFPSSTVWQSTPFVKTYVLVISCIP